MDPGELAFDNLYIIYYTMLRIYTMLICIFYLYISLDWKSITCFASRILLFRHHMQKCKVYLDAAGFANELGALAQLVTA